MSVGKNLLTNKFFCHTIIIQGVVISSVRCDKNCTVGEMPAEMQSKSRRDSLLPYWGQIIAIQYYRVFDTLSKREL